MKTSFKKIVDGDVSLSVGAILIFIIGCAAYWPALRGGFVWDDNAMLKENLLITGQTGLWPIWFSTAPIDYFPLTYSNLWLEWRFWGQNPMGYHVTNLFLHAACCFLLWRVLLKLEIPGAWLAALLFLVHPVCVESVAWIAERKNTLSLFFYLLTLLLFLRFDQTRQKLFCWLSLLAFLLSLLSKTSGVMLPFVLLLVAWWQREKISRNDWLRTIPFFGLSLVLGLVTVWFQTHRAIGGDLIENHDLWTRVAAAGWSFWFYLWKSFLPINLAFIYPEWDINPRSLVVYLPGIAVPALFVLCWRFRRSRGRPLFFALACFFLALFPVLGFFKMYFQKFSFVANHWQYLALPAVGTLISALIYRFPNVLFRRCFATALVAAFAILTWQHAAIFRSEKTVWLDTLEKNPRCWLAYNNLALIYKNEGNFDKAMECNQRSLQIRPHQVDANNNLGVLFYARGDLDFAMQHYRAAMAVNPNHPSSYANIGAVFDQRGQTSAALESYREALRLDPHHPQANNNLGCLLLQGGKPQEAEVHFRNALKWMPDSADTLCNLGSALLEQGDPVGAEFYLSKAVAFDLRHANAHFVFGNALFAQEKFTEAIRKYDDASRLKPGMTAAHLKSGNALLRLKQNGEAIKQFSTALEQQPGLTEAHYQLAVLFERQNQTADAIQHYKQAVRLKPDWLEPLNNLAWILATHPDEKIRDGKLAVEFAERACALTENKNPGVLDTLAAAYAEDRQFLKATDTAKNAADLAAASGQKEMAEQIHARLELYRAEKPFHE